VREVEEDFNERQGEIDFEEEEMQGTETMADASYDNHADRSVEEAEQDEQRGRIIQRMELEGLNFTLFFKYLKSLRKQGDLIQLGAVLKALETNYPTTSSAERVFLIQDCI
jgi:hypothetical protein